MSKIKEDLDDQQEERMVEIDIDGAGSDDEFDIEIVDDTPEADRGRKALTEPVDEPTDEELQTYGERARKRIEKLTHARHDERRSKEESQRQLSEASRAAQALAAENQRLRSIVQDGTKVFNENSVKLVEAEIVEARRKLKEAQETYDDDQVLAAQEALFDARLKLDRVKNSPVAPLQQAPAAVQPRQPQAEEAPIDDKSLRWQQKNQWFGVDGYEEVTGFALALEQKLVRNGSDPRSEAHFEQIDARLRETFPKMFGSAPAPTGQSRGPKPSVVAPASRVSGPRKVTLTQTQLALARQWGLTPQQYAAEVLKLEKPNG